MGKMTKNTIPCNMCDNIVFVSPNQSPKRISNMTYCVHILSVHGFNFNCWKTNKKTIVNLKAIITTLDWPAFLEWGVCSTRFSYPQHEAIYRDKNNNNNNKINVPIKMDIANKQTKIKQANHLMISLMVVFFYIFRASKHVFFYLDHNSIKCWVFVFAVLTYYLRS